MKLNKTAAWHQLQSEEVVRLLEVDLKSGLSKEEVQRRQKKYGPNQVTVQKGIGALRRFLLQFHQPLVYILLAAIVITAGLKEWVDAFVIFGVVLVNAIVGYLQETKAEKAINSLAQMVVTETTVRRDGHKQRIPSKELVPGDIVLLQSGDKVPADLRLYQVRNLQVDEAALTGESIPVEKHSDPLVLDTILAERKNLAFAGTLVTYGQAEGVVWAIGDKTETGRIATLISEAVNLSTPLTRKIAHFSNLLLIIILGLATLTFVVGVWRNHSPVDMFMAAVALAVGAIPEGLPAAVTVTLAIGVARMARRRAIIRNLPAVETLGSTTVICSDKTGTLTENRMTVQEIFAGNQQFEVTQEEDPEKGQICYCNKPISVSSNVALMECLKAGLLCNDSRLVRKADRLTVQGDPTEGALIVSAQKGGLIETEIAERHPRLDVIPFESEYQYMATLHKKEGKEKVIYKKGAAERLLERCTTTLDANGKSLPLNKEKLRQVSEEMAKRGLRVLAFARDLVPHTQHQISHHHVSKGLTFLGLQGMIDPPRPEVIEAIHKCHTAGIRVKMITGDHLLTAQAIGQQIGLKGNQEGKLLAVEGRELEKYSTEKLKALVEETAIFARVPPEQKLRIVKACQAHGHIVAMTGDGVNDAPALKQADIGIAMGITGTDVAKQAADMVLTDDNFASIEAAVEEGRGVFDNLSKFIVWELPNNAGEAAVLLVAVIADLTLPLLPVQILWINLVTAIFLGLTLLFEPKESHIMSRPPRDPQAPLLTFPLVMRTGLVTLIILVGALGLFFWEQKYKGVTLAEARTITVNVIVMVEIFYLFNCRSLTRSVFSLGFFSNFWIPIGITAMIVAQLAFTYLPLMNRLFHTAPIEPLIWWHITGVGLVAGVIVGFEKWVRFHFKTGAFNPE